MVRGAKKSGGFLSNKSGNSGVKKDFEKKKLKVGKGKVVPRNQTNVDQFRAKRVVLARQSILEDKSGASAKLQAILSQVRHYNVFKRRDALIALKNFCFAEDYKDGESYEHRLTSAVEAAAKVLNTVTPCICDADIDVRRLCSEFLSVLFSALPYQDIQPFGRLLCAQLRAGITHVDSEIRADTSSFLAAILSQGDIGIKNAIMPPAEAAKLANAFLSSQKVTVHNLECVALLLQRAAADGCNGTKGQRNDGVSSSSAGGGPFTLAACFGATVEEHNPKTTKLSDDTSGKLSKQLLNLWLDINNAGLTRSPAELTKRRLLIAESTNAAIALEWLSISNCGSLVEAVLKDFPARPPSTSSDRHLYELIDELNYAKGQLLESKPELLPKEQKLVVSFLVEQAERITTSTAAKRSSETYEVTSLGPWMSLASKALQPSRKVGHLRQLTRATLLVRKGLWRLAGLDVEEEDDMENSSVDNQESGMKWDSFQAFTVPLSEQSKKVAKKGRPAKRSGGAFAILAEDSDDESMEGDDTAVEEEQTNDVMKKGHRRAPVGQLPKVTSVGESKVYPVAAESPLFLQILPTVAAMCSTAVEEPPSPLREYPLNAICSRVVSEGMRSALLRRLPRLAWHLSIHHPGGPELLYVLSVIGQLTAAGSAEAKEQFVPIQALLTPLYCGVHGGAPPLIKMSVDSQMVAVALLSYYSKMPKAMMDSLSKLSKDSLLLDEPSNLLKLTLERR
ncbi:hypothetical protein FOL47_010791 [Perkinsus chesapeaki]|uniref:Testis-expressed sequence 10 protein n=1 Tax=Perkinsus chesapeaki TaxID=330153 RepID=A0A7J6MP28_PERCH|nr:hypothetical protein FOL47_010791 [Perkinsus chesapeaki]